MFNTRRGALFAAVCSAGLALGLAAPASAETLAEAIALAYDSNPTLQAQRATQRALDENWVQARSGYRPQASAQGRVGYSEVRRPGGVDRNLNGIRDPEGRNLVESNSAIATLSLSQPLYTGGRVAATVSAAEADILTGRENLRRTESSVLQAVIQAYVDVRRDQEALRIRQENVGVLRRQLDESTARFDVGEITRTDVAQSEARLAAAQSLLTQAQAQLAISRAAYAALVGQNPGDLAPEPSLATLLPADVTQAFAAAEESNPQIRAAEYAQQASKARVAAAKAERMPTVGLNGSLGVNGSADPWERDLFGREVAASATVSVPLFTGGLTSSRIRAAMERNNADRIGVETARRSVMQSLTGAWNQLIASRSNITSTDEQVKASRIAAEGTRQEQQVGLRTTLDVLNAEQELRQAELAQVTARRDEYVAASLVLAQMGLLEGPNLVPTVTRYDPKANFGKLRVTWGWVPWEEPIAIVDGVTTPKTVEKPTARPVAAPN
ncbi:TolC family outer membrane protein [Phenylobacterium sp.]|uniref:TolC family outer membrane protein n=1 Tax=Phenylobacterium sp. TaxID=1871053 RepID=UPI00272F1D96|nr:TolC family outer membrane protein [Phenylobacterium sp.]MDP1600664.1 TolC family outer membrane protein [Phenylobacterium sp.]MDP3591507.1 TolC family outer membrane protein [Phenylobacterium sp.]